METYKVLGLMSGTSLDGLDIAYCEFVKEADWKFSILQSETIPYDHLMVEKLRVAHEMSSYELCVLDVELGRYFGEQAGQFINRHSLEVDFISSHGHTVFHQPEKSLTVQIGKGVQIAVAGGLPVVCDFRSQDVAYGGQGAPLVPIGDQLLFSHYDACINLGGFANMSTQRNGDRIAWDICPVNTVLNSLMRTIGKEYDDKGELARAGTVEPELLRRLNELDFYQRAYPKSLGIEWVNANILPIIESSLPLQDRLHTLVIHISQQISRSLNSVGAKSTLVTGGGAYNSFLIEKLRDSGVDLVVPDDNLIQFKEAMIFAFLGVLRWRNEINVLSSFTGAKSDHCSGVIYK